MNSKIIENIISRKGLLLLVFVEHLFFFYFNNILHKDALVDSLFYYKAAAGIHSLDLFFVYLVPGTGITVLLVSLFVKIFNSFLAVSLIFSVISFTAYYYFVKDYYEKVIYNSFYTITFLMLLFLPSMHWWTAGIYKEALILPLMYFILRRINRLFTFWTIFLFSLLILIRPYLGPVILAGIVLRYRSFINRKIIISISIATVLLVLVFVTGLKSVFGTLNMETQFEELYKYSQTGVAIIDIKETTYWERLIYMMFRPLFFDADTSMKFIYSFENAIFLGWFSLFLYKIVRKKINRSFLFKNIYFTSSLFIWLFIGIYIYNYGLASRMKVMIVPFLLIGVLETIKKTFSEKNC
ncbi:hypothetical protein [Chryseobacterium sp.]|uniref:hypothetical protein n=1 Tax=Chryseobacterium sp. TaxID=1871047 RepID=UPI0025BF9D73|nr:hypothetical protein [Chryseobacterium sp.]MBV8328648.1 hypothetical protein [Chryseobacterium sp.]